MIIVNTHIYNSVDVGIGCEYLCNQHGAGQSKRQASEQSTHRYFLALKQNVVHKKHTRTHSHTDTRMHAYSEEGTHRYTRTQIHERQKLEYGKRHKER